jgi:hypothetical protein
MHAKIMPLLKNPKLTKLKDYYFANLSCFIKTFIGIE